MVYLQIGCITAVAKRVKCHEHDIVGAQAVQTYDRIGVGRSLAVPKVPEVAIGIAAVVLEFDADGVADRIGKEGRVEQCIRAHAAFKIDLDQPQIAVLALIVGLIDPGCGRKCLSGAPGTYSLIDRSVRTESAGAGIHVLVGGPAEIGSELQRFRILFEDHEVEIAAVCAVLKSVRADGHIVHVSEVSGIGCATPTAQIDVQTVVHHEGRRGHIGLISVSDDRAPKQLVHRAIDLLQELPSGPAAENARAHWHISETLSEEVDRTVAIGFHEIQLIHRRTADKAGAEVGTTGRIELEYESV